MYTDIGKMKRIVEKSKEPIPYMHPLKPVINEIVAMVREGARCRYVAEWANDVMEIKEGQRYDNKQIWQLINKTWTKEKRIDERKVEFLRQQIRAYREKVEPPVKWVEEDKPVEVKQEVSKAEETKEVKQSVVAVNPFESL